MVSAVSNKLPSVPAVIVLPASTLGTTTPLIAAGLNINLLSVPEVSKLPASADGPIANAVTSTFSLPVTESRTIEVPSTLKKNFSVPASARKSDDRLWPKTTLFEDMVCSLWVDYESFVLNSTESVGDIREVRISVESV